VAGRLHCFTGPLPRRETPQTSVTGTNETRGSDEADLPTKYPKEGEKARFSASDGDARRACGHKGAPAAGTGSAVGLSHSAVKQSRLQSKWALCCQLLQEHLARHVPARSRADGRSPS
jgi:hypothetical protein